MPENDEDWNGKVPTWINSGLLYSRREWRESNVNIYKLKIKTQKKQQMNENGYICFGAHHVVSLLSDSIFSCLIHPECCNIPCCLVLRIILSPVSCTICLQQGHKQHKTRTFRFRLPESFSMQNWIKWINKMLKMKF